MNPDLTIAIDRLAEEGVLPGDVAPLLSRIARGDLLSIRAELRTLLYTGIALIAAGGGWFVKEHYREIGPVAITLALTAAAAGCFFYVVRRAAPYSWSNVPAPTLAFDYLLLLGILLFGSDLAYVESQFRVLGPNWKYHLLLFSIASLVAAYRFDSAAVLSLALSSFAAWRGVSVRDPVGIFFGGPGARVRVNAILCGILFLAAAIASVRTRRKPHFEPVWGNLGCVLLFGGLLSGALGSPRWTLWEVPLLAAAAAALVAALRVERESYAAIAILAGYAGLMRMLLHPFRDERLIFAVVSFSGIAVLVVLLGLHRRMRERRAP